MLSYRTPTPEDCTVVYEWICDPLTRSYSFGPPPENYSAHETWFMKRICENHGLYYIFYLKDYPQDLVGQVRVDEKEEGMVVSILTAPAHRGKGFAAKMLQALVELHKSGHFGSQQLRAWIMNNNTASQKAFEKNGFRFIESSDIAGISSKLFIYP